LMLIAAVAMVHQVQQRVEPRQAMKV
jgi:hypothetical protein